MVCLKEKEESRARELGTLETTEGLRVRVLDVGCVRSACPQDRHGT